jgi:hypothetical protein
MPMEPIRPFQSPIRVHSWLNSDSDPGYSQLSRRGSDRLPPSGSELRQSGSLPSEATGFHLRFNCCSESGSALHQLYPGQPVGVHPSTFLLPPGDCM